MSAPPTVSVILPVYNGENYLRCAIDSVLSQSFRDYELIVVDDGSVDSTPSIAREYGARLRYVRQENTGVAGAFNYGISFATGRYISWLSHDDIFLPAKLAKQVEALEECAEPAAAYTDVQTIDSAGNVSSEHHLPQRDKPGSLREIITGGPLCMASYSITYHRKCLDEVGCYSLRWRYLQDADMLARLARHFRLIHIPEILMQVREHPSRGIYSAKWGEEAVRFYERQLKNFSLRELFADPLNRRERAEARRWLGDRMCAAGFPISRLALSQYFQALKDDPARSFEMLHKSQWVIRRYLRDYLRSLLRSRQ